MGLVTPTTCLLAGVFCSYLLFELAGGMFLLQDRTQMYSNMTMEMDMVHRGTFNISHCIYHLMTCWELVKPDTICSYHKYYESICGVMHEFCDDLNGDEDHYSFRFEMFEQFCPNRPALVEYWT